MSNFRAGIIGLLVVACGTYMGFAKRVPWAGDFEVRAVFAQANEVHGRTPVRIAGVNVGRVKHVERGPGTSVIVTMAIDEDARPIHRDATAKIRPRIFLEGNFFVDLQPGTGRTGELGDGGVIPLAQTATPVQLDQVLSALDADTRGNLQTVLREYAAGLDQGGAAALRRAIPEAERALEGLSILLGGARGQRPDDLSAAIRADGRLAAALSERRRDLAALVTGLARATQALADRQEEVGATVRGLAATARAAHPALGDVNAALPSLRRFVADVRPVLREAPRTLDLALPLLRQLDRLVAPQELGALVEDLGPAVRTLAAVEPKLDELLGLVKPVTDCVRDHALPVLTTPIEDGHLSTGQPPWQELLHVMPGLASASQNFDGSGNAVRYHGGYGDQLFSTGRVGREGVLYGLAPEPVLGSSPPQPDVKPPFRPDVPCRGQKVPDLRVTPKPAPAGRPGRLDRLGPRETRRIERLLARALEEARR